MKKAWFWTLLTIAQLAAFRIYGSILLSHFAVSGFQIPPDLGVFRSNAALALRHVSLASPHAQNYGLFLYPPPFLLVATPFTLYSPMFAYLAWSAATAIALAATAIVMRLSWAATGLALLSPPVMCCMAVGQSGGIVSVLLLLSLFLSPSRPMLAGLLGGCLIIKPQFALLLPICYFASGNMRAFLSAGVSAAAFCVASVAIFGIGPWQYFYTHETAAAWNVLDMPWPQPFQAIMVSPFMLFRSLGAGLRISYGLQLLVTIGAAGAAWVIWRPQQRIDRYLKLLLTVCLVPLAMPYSYIYDLPALSIALVAYVAQGRWRDLLPLSGFWVVTSLYILISMISYLTGAAFLLLLVGYLMDKTAPVRGMAPRPEAVPLP